MSEHKTSSAKLVGVGVVSESSIWIESLELVQNFSADSLDSDLAFEHKRVYATLLCQNLESLQEDPDRSEYKVVLFSFDFREVAEKAECLHIPQGKSRGDCRMM